MSSLIKLIYDIKSIVEEYDRICELDKLYKETFDKDCCKKYSEYNYDNILCKYNSDNTNSSDNYKQPYDEKYKPNNNHDNENNQLVIYNQTTFNTNKYNIKDKNKLDKDNLNKDNLNKDNLNKDNLNKDNLNKDNLNKDNLNKDNLNKDNLDKDNLNKDNLNKDNLNNNNTNYIGKYDEKKMKKNLLKLIKKLYKCIIIKVHPDRNKYKKKYNIKLYNEFILLYENKDLLKIILLYNDLNINKVFFSNNDIICLETEKNFKNNIINNIKNSIHWKWCTQLDNRQKNIVKKNYSNILRNLNI